MPKLEYESNKMGTKWKHRYLQKMREEQTSVHSAAFYFPTSSNPKKSAELHSINLNSRVDVSYQILSVIVQDNAILSSLVPYYSSQHYKLIKETSS